MNKISKDGGTLKIFRKLVLQNQKINSVNDKILINRLQRVIIKYSKQKS